MIRALLLIAFAVAPLMPTGDRAEAADMKMRTSVSRSVMVLRPLPFPRSERAQSVWASRACWTQCGSFTAWDQAACLQRDAQGTCLKLADDADRSCQRQCRSSGGPLLPLDF
ncbi:MAG: hypothetical protein Q7T81_04720 [Pseudolabrys sp.]|nr:hypothetical protein [Pseudolabrys sp.]